jgi:hypothetical protein
MQEVFDPKQKINELKILATDITPLQKIANAVDKVVKSFALVAEAHRSLMQPIPKHRLTNMNEPQPAAIVGNTFKPELIFIKNNKLSDLLLEEEMKTDVEGICAAFGIKSELLEGGASFQITSVVPEPIPQSWYITLDSKKYKKRWAEQYKVSRFVKRLYGRKSTTVHNKVKDLLSKIKH